jgi:prevent-host-death family protein
MSTTPVEAARHARDHFSEILERDVPTIVTRHGRQIAAIVPIADYRRYEELEEQELHRLIAERKGEAAHPGHSLEEVLAETLARDE